MSSHGQLSNRHFQRIAEFMKNNTGIHFPEAKRYLIEGRLRKRQRAMSFKTLDAYVDFVLEDNRGRDESLHLIDALTTNKTDFFREKNHFDWLAQSFIPVWSKTRIASQKSPLRIWSAGCSSGEEPYSIAMLMSEASKQYPDLDFSILATDISTSMLDVAARGVYPHDRVDPVPMRLRQEYFLRSADKRKNLVKMSPGLRSKVKFRHFNLIADAFDFSHQFDMIFCRNVMIYFNKPERDRLINRFVSVLKPNGIFFTGHSERMTEEVKDLIQVQPTVYRKA